MNLATWLERAAARDPQATAIFHGDRPWCTRRQLASRAARVAGALRARGLGPGDRVAFFMANTPEYLLGLYGAWWAGLVAVPINAKLHARELAYIVEHSGARDDTSRCPARRGRSRIHRRRGP